MSYAFFCPPELLQGTAFAGFTVVPKHKPLKIILSYKISAERQFLLELMAAVVKKNKINKNHSVSVELIKNTGGRFMQRQLLRHRQME